MKLNQTSNYTTKSGCVLKLSSSSSIILHEIPLVLIIPRQIHPTFSSLSSSFTFRLYTSRPASFSSVYIYISTIFHDQPPVDDYANYRRNVLVTARNQRKGWLKQRGWTRRYFSPLSRPPPSCSTPTLGWRGKEKDQEGDQTPLFLWSKKDRERKRERENGRRDNFSADRTNSSYVDKRREKGGRNELLSSLGKRTRVCPTRVLKSRVVCTRREIIRANIVKISGGTRNKHGGGERREEPGARKIIGGIKKRFLFLNGE